MLDHREPFCTEPSVMCKCGKYPEYSQALELKTVFFFKKTKTKTTNSSIYLALSQVRLTKESIESSYDSLRCPGHCINKSLQNSNLYYASRRKTCRCDKPTVQQCVSLCTFTGKNFVFSKHFIATCHLFMRQCYCY